MRKARVEAGLTKALVELSPGRTPRLFAFTTLRCAFRHTSFDTIRECLMKKLFWFPASAMALFLMPEIAQAHFTLVEPASWLVEVNQLGDPQKLAPCGGTSQNAGTPTGALAEAMGVAALQIKLRETVFDPGHYL